MNESHSKRFRMNESDRKSSARLWLTCLISLTLAFVLLAGSVVANFLWGVEARRTGLTIRIENQTDTVLYVNTSAIGDPTEGYEVVPPGNRGYIEVLHKDNYSLEHEIHVVVRTGDDVVVAEWNGTARELVFEMPDQRLTIDAGDLKEIAHP